MVAIRITLRKEEDGEKLYIEERLKYYPEIIYKIAETKKFVHIDIRSELKCVRKIVKEIISSVVLLFYKYKFIKEGVTAAAEGGLTTAALFGALLSFDADQEALCIEKALADENAFPIHTIYEFQHEKLRESWRNIVALANKLLSQCDADDEIYDLIFFLLAIDNAVAPKIRIEGSANGSSVFADHIPLPIPKLTRNTDEDMVIAVVREKPSSIVITDPSFVSEKLLAAIKRLGEENSRIL